MIRDRLLAAFLIAVFLLPNAHADSRRYFGSSGSGIVTLTDSKYSAKPLWEPFDLIDKKSGRIYEMTKLACVMNSCWYYQNQTDDYYEPQALKELMNGDGGGRLEVVDLNKLGGGGGGGNKPSPTPAPSPNPAGGDKTPSPTPAPSPNPAGGDKTPSPTPAPSPNPAGGDKTPPPTPAPSPNPTGGGGGSAGSAGSTGGGGGSAGSTGGGGGSAGSTGGGGGSAGSTGGGGGYSDIYVISTGAGTFYTDSPAEACSAWASMTFGADFKLTSVSETSCSGLNGSWRYKNTIHKLTQDNEDLNQKIEEGCKSTAIGSRVKGANFSVICTYKHNPTAASPSVDSLSSESSTSSSSSSNQGGQAAESGGGGSAGGGSTGSNAPAPANGGGTGNTQGGGTGSTQGGGTGNTQGGGTGNTQGGGTGNTQGGGTGNTQGGGTGNTQGGGAGNTQGGGTGNTQGGGTGNTQGGGTGNTQGGGDGQGGGDLGDIGDFGESDFGSLGSSFDGSFSKSGQFSESGYCPQPEIVDVSFAEFSGSFELSYDLFCEFAKTIRIFVVMSGWAFSSLMVYYALSRVAT